MRFNVLIATHGRPTLLRRTLENLAEARRPAGFEHVWVIENGSDAGARQICVDLESRLPLRYMHCEQAGKSRAFQQVFETLGDGFVLLLDDDVRVCPELLEIYGAAASAHGERAFFGGPLLIDFEKPPPDWLLPHLPFSAKGWLPVDPEESLRWNRFLGANMGVWVKRVLEAGGFDARFGPGANRSGTDGNPTGQDTEFQNRLLEKGDRPIYLPKAFVWHWVPEDRCSPAWALHRAYRTAITETLFERAPVPGKLLFGAPRWMYRVKARLYIRAKLTSFWLAQPARFARQKEFQRWRGKMEGLRLLNQAKAEEQPR